MVKLESDQLNRNADSHKLFLKTIKIYSCFKDKLEYIFYSSAQDAMNAQKS